MILNKVSSLLNHPSVTPSAIFFVSGIVTGTVFSGTVGTMGTNFLYIVHDRWWLLFMLLWMGGIFYFKLESYKIDTTAILEHETLNKLREQAEQDVADEWGRIRQQNKSCQELHHSLSIDQRKLVEERRQLRKERAAYLQYTEETAEKLKRKSKSLVGKLAATDPSRAKRFEAENNRLMKHLESAPERTKPMGLRPPTIKR